MNPPAGGDKPTARVSFVHSPLLSLSRPPPGKVPDKTDEICFTYAFQTARGRSQNHEPKTYSICLRKVYPHEVSDYLLGKGWRTQQSNSIPLPPEGQPTQERFVDDSEESLKPDEDETRYWEEGWYLWTTTSNKNAVEKLYLMSQSLKSQDRYLQDKLHREHEEHEKAWIEQLRGRVRVELDGTLSSVPPSDYLHYYWYVFAFLNLGLNRSWRSRQSSSLTQIPTSLRPLFDPMRRLLTPTTKVLDIFRRSFQSGSQREFAHRLLEKARSPEPFVLGRRLFKKAWEMISGPPDAKPDL
ncbi:hypothetical protein JVU11DRAFT_7318 [Chiua virens]|nr:hypothetical protein JVU11DRAFT_7318 [Chiua virens]